MKYLLEENEAKIDDYYDKNEKPLSFNTVIVGAGCGGLYSAYRLFKHGNHEAKNVSIF